MKTHKLLSNFHIKNRKNLLLKIIVHILIEKIHKT